ncbi:unnamed protein product, partial [Pylaiella littoralis]
MYDSSSSIWIVVLVEVGLVAFSNSDQACQGLGRDNSGGVDSRSRVGLVGVPSLGMVIVRVQVVPPGSQLPAYPEPSAEYDYSRYTPNLPRPNGNQPPIHDADPRKRCT